MQGDILSSDSRRSTVDDGKKLSILSVLCLSDPMGSGIQTRQRLFIHLERSILLKGISQLYERENLRKLRGIDILLLSMTMYVSVRYFLYIVKMML